MARELALVAEIRCELDEEHFEDWSDLTSEQQVLFEDHILPCEGSGRMGLYCDGCVFCSYFDVDRYDV